eukprot:GFKZ01008200.1.p1 GENE.GFKZ01008200.1~~GFKZ01008200.1.p1  ORF type:complete len:178 (-),score=20.06 GFKZ01008200.1:7-540(-)
MCFITPLARARHHCTTSRASCLTSPQVSRAPGLKTGGKRGAVMCVPTVNSRGTSAGMRKTGGKRIDESWPSFADGMRETGEIPDYEAWHGLLDSAYEAEDEPWRAVWLLNLMRETGRVPTAVTYDKVLGICARRGDRETAFSLVEGMWKDKVLLGDVELPEGMEEVLRKILPPEAFE